VRIKFAPQIRRGASYARQNDPDFSEFARVRVDFDRTRMFLDNAIVFAEGASGFAADQWFARLGGIVADILHEVGVPYCKGGVMARNPAWRGSRATWSARIADWITRSNPADLLSVDIFFDLVGVHGNAALANELWRSAFDVAQGNVTFAKLLAEAVGEVESGVNFLGSFRTENGRIDLKKAGLFGIVTTARVLAIRHHLLERSTPARLSAVAGLGRGGGPISTRWRVCTENFSVSFSSSNSPICMTACRRTTRL
jgi:CBS domain-containing protein